MPRVLKLVEEPVQASSRILLLAFAFERGVASVIANLLDPCDLRSGAFQTTEDAPGWYTVAAAGSSGGEVCGSVTLSLHNVSLLQQRVKVSRALDCLLQWSDAGCPTEWRSSDVCGALAEWWVRGGGKGALDENFEFQRYTGSLLLESEVRQGYLDVPGAMLRWWAGGEHSGWVWSFHQAGRVTVPVPEERGPDAFDELVQRLGEEELRLSHCIHLDTIPMVRQGTGLRMRGQSVSVDCTRVCAGQDPAEQLHWAFTTDSDIAEPGAMTFGGLFEELVMVMTPKEGAAGFTITCSMLPQDEEDVEIEGESAVGILWLHEYAALAVRRVEGSEYIRVMNPHGHGGEWNGKLSDAALGALADEQPPGREWSPVQLLLCLEHRDGSILHVSIVVVGQACSGCH